MYITYVLRSKVIGRHYIGHTQDLIDRLSRHNRGKVKVTKQGRPWWVVHAEQFNTRSEAYRRELEIKSYKGGIKFKKLIGLRHN